jgi:hypothetical protein
MSYEGRSPFGRAFTAADNAAMTNLRGEDLVFRSPAATKPRSDLALRRRPDRHGVANLRK